MISASVAVCLCRFFPLNSGQAKIRTNPVNAALKHKHRYMILLETERISLELHDQALILHFHVHDRAVQRKELLATKMLPLFVWKQLMQSPKVDFHLRYTNFNHVVLNSTKLTFMIPSLSQKNSHRSESVCY